MSFSPSVIPSLSPTSLWYPTSSPTINLYRQQQQQQERDEFILLVSISIGILFFGIVGTYCLSKCVDRFLSTEIDEAIIRRIEQMMNNQNNRNGNHVVLDGMTPEERRRVLERVLDLKPYSIELGAQVKMERERAEESKKIQKMEEHDSSPEQALSQGEIVGSEMEENDDHSSSKEEKKEEEEINILQRVWEEFGSSKNIKKGKGRNNQAQPDGGVATLTELEGSSSTGKAPVMGEVTETCAICMEDYEEHQDVIIGHNCDHMYHKECLLKWMQTKHDLCPYCRLNVFCVETFKEKAAELLGSERYQELIKDEDSEEAEGSATFEDNQSIDDDNRAAERRDEGR